MEAEIHQNAWLNVPADEALLFSDKADTLWREALGKLQVDPGALSGTAGHA